ncbi:MAG: hypothetical protein U0802_14575 [Candidatus Binatia bacterium]
MALADLNGDHVTDMVVVDRDDDAIHVLLGIGDGTFHDPVDYFIDGTPTAVAVANVASSSPRRGRRHRRPRRHHRRRRGRLRRDPPRPRRRRDFDPPEQDLSDALDALELIGVAVLDLDRNGRLDLVFLDSFDEVYFLCNELGVFARPAPPTSSRPAAAAPSPSRSPTSTSTASPTSPCSSLDSQDVRVIRGLGGGSFETTPSYVTSVVVDSATQEPAALAAAALDDVGDELIVANAGAPASALAVLSYAESALRMTPSPGSATTRPRCLAVAGFDGDTIPDLATIGGAAPALTVARGDGAR